MRIINGEGDSWRLPIQLNTNSLEPINACDVGKEEEARHEAAYKLISNSKNVARFACRRKQFQAPLADPYAVPNEKYVDSVDAFGTSPTLLRSAEPLQPSEPKKDKEMQSWLLERTSGVPRDMSYPAGAIPCTSQLGHRPIRLIRIKYTTAIITTMHYTIR